MLQHGAVDLDTLRMQVVEPPKYGGCRRRPSGNRWIRRCLARYSPAALVIYNPSPGPHVQRHRPLPPHHAAAYRGHTLCRLRGSPWRRRVPPAGAPRAQGLPHWLQKGGRLRHAQDMDQSSLRICYTPRIVAPGLASLHLVLLRDYAPLWLFEMPSLVEATVMLHTGRALPWFHNLTTLLLDECDEGDDVDLLLDFFVIFAPNLEKLTLQHCTFPTRAQWMAENPMSMNMSGCQLKLTSVEIKHREKDDVCEIIDYLLFVSKNLQRTGIVLSKGPEIPWWKNHKALAAQGWYN
ncbi:unnamed protein product [Alopecurus aequalis]